MCHPPWRTKILSDILTSWSADAGERLGAVDYVTPLYSSKALNADALGAMDPFIAADRVRVFANETLKHIELLEALPGGRSVRIGSNENSLAEIRFNIENLVRFRIPPLMASLRARGMPSIDVYLDRQIAYVSRDRLAAEHRIRAIQDSFNVFSSAPGAVSGQGMPLRDTDTEGGAAALNGQSMITQFSDGFLDRMLEMSASSNDRAYRHDLADRAIDESMLASELAKEEEFYKGYESYTGRSGSDLDGRSAVVGLAEMLGMYADQAVAAYQEISGSNLGSDADLYIETLPFRVQTERVLTLATVGFYTMIVFLLSLFVVPMGCLVHRYVARHRELESHDTRAAL